MKGCLLPARSAEFLKLLGGIKVKFQALQKNSSESNIIECSYRDTYFESLIQGQNKLS